MQRKSLKVDPATRDLVVSGGALKLAHDIDVVLQNCDHAMRQQLGELRYNQGKGIDFFGNVFGGNPNFQIFRFQAIQNLQNVDGVKRVLDFRYDLEDGKLNYTAEILTDYGTGAINGNL